MLFEMLRQTEINTLQFIDEMEVKNFSFQFPSFYSLIYSMCTFSTRFAKKNLFLRI